MPRSSRFACRGTTAAALAAAALAFPGPAGADDPDFSGMWTPEPELAVSWSADTAPFTPAGREAFEAYEPSTMDSAAYCMPLGTPRNVLATAPEPLEILQRPEQITLLFSPLNDVRRIFLGDRGRSDMHFANWAGESLGRWEGDTLVVETIGVTDQSVLDASGMPHSEDMTVTERLRLVRRGGRRLLEVEIVIEDPVNYAEPLHATRYYRPAADIAPSEGSVPCLIDQWRREVEREARAAARRARAPEGQ